MVVFLAAAVAVYSVAAGLILYANAIALHSDPGPIPIGDYVRLLVVDITMWGPVVLITVWPVSAGPCSSCQVSSLHRCGAPVLIVNRSDLV